MNAPDTGYEQADFTVSDEPDDEIIVAVRCGQEETSRWRLQPQEACWQIAQIAEDLEDHLLGLVEADDQRTDNQ